VFENDLNTLMEEMNERPNQRQVKRMLGQLEISIRQFIPDEEERNVVIDNIKNEIGKKTNKTEVITLIKRSSKKLSSEFLQQTQDRMATASTHCLTCGSGILYF